MINKKELIMIGTNKITGITEELERFYNKNNLSDLAYNYRGTHYNCKIKQIKNDK